MPYKINEIFYSLQGEGVAAGQPAVFIRFSGCNQNCSFCDTDFSNYQTMTAEQIVLQIKNILPEKIRENIYWRFILTGGEPTLQIDPPLLHTLRTEFRERRQIQIETNATTLPECGVLLYGCFFTASPKTRQGIAALKKYFAMSGKSDGVFNDNSIEVKLVYNDDNPALKSIIMRLEEISPPNIPMSIQPCDYQDAEKNQVNLQKCIQFIKENPRWRLSLQTHKLLNIR